jgi:DNA-binding transcriptional ArsR family regulator
MTATNPNVRDFTETAPARVRLEVDPSPAYELLLEMFVLESAQEADDFTVGSEWVEAARNRLADGLRSELDELGTKGEIWLTLLGMVYDTPAPKTIDAFISRIAALDPLQLRSAMLANAWFTKKGNVDPATVAEAVAGSAEALAHLAQVADECDCGPGWAYILGMSPESAQRLLVKTLQAYAETADAEGMSELLDRDARAKRALASTLPTSELVERATNGITFENRAGVAGVILVPSVVLRPLVVITEHGAMRMFCYPINEEALTAQPGAPPSWLVDYYKALGDDKRIRLLTILAEGEASLTELVDRLDLAKSTVHHHLRMLRTAGFVRVTVGDEHRYSLRPDALAQAGPLLETYLTNNKASERVQ